LKTPFYRRAGYLEQAEKSVGWELDAWVFVHALKMATLAFSRRSRAANAAAYSSLQWAMQITIEGHGVNMMLRNTSQGATKRVFKVKRSLWSETAAMGQAALIVR
jgi:hypothetical protein